jgi:WD40 repeat protein
VVCDVATLQPIGPAIPFQRGIGIWGEFVLTPDGNRVVFSLAGERAARVYDVKTGQLAFPELPHGVPFTGIGFSADSTVYATNAIDGQIRLWDLRTGALFAECALKLDRRGTAALSRDGRTLLVVSATGSAHRLEVTHGVPAPLVLLQTWVHNQVSFVENPPARILVLSNTTATMREVASGREVEGGLALPQPTLAVNRDWNDRTVRAGDVWIARTASAGRTLWTWGESGPPRETAFGETFPDSATLSPLLSRNQHLAVVQQQSGTRGRAASPVELWDLRTGKRMSEIMGPGRLGAVSAVAFSGHDQRFVMGKEPTKSLCWFTRFATASCCSESRRRAMATFSPPASIAMARSC